METNFSPSMQSYSPENETLEASNTNSGLKTDSPIPKPMASESQPKSARDQVEELLAKLKKAKDLQNKVPEDKTDQLLNGLSFKDFPMLCRARAKLTIASRNKKIYVFFCAQITAMVGTLNLYLDPMLSYT